MLHPTNQPSAEIQQYLNQLYQPAPDSHKGQNGKLLVIGGSQLFHSAIFWAADAASRIVDIVHFTSPANENNKLMRFKLKQSFWSGIVVDWSKVTDYLAEDDVILIGPGMDRSTQTKQIINNLLAKFSGKKWVIDGGALQMVDPQLLKSTHIITPHRGELDLILSKTSLESLLKNGVTILAKNKVDHVYSQSNQGKKQVIPIEGGNPGMTKGGTGDVLAGVVAAFYCQNQALVASVVASYLVKKAGDKLWQERGQFFNAGDLVENLFFPA